MSKTDPTDYEQRIEPALDDDKSPITDSSDGDARHWQTRNQAGRSFGGVDKVQAVAVSGNIVDGYPSVFELVDTSAADVTRTVAGDMTGRDGWIVKLRRSGANNAILAYAGGVENATISADGEERWWRYNETADAFQHVALPTGGGYQWSTTEFLTGNRDVAGDPIYGKAVDLGSWPNTTTKTVAHGVTGIKSLISLTGYGTDGTVRYSIPRSSPTLASNVDLIWLDATDIRIHTGGNLTSFSGYALLLYTKV